MGRQKRYTIIFQQLQNFVNHEIWYIPTIQLSKVNRFFLKILKIILIAIKEFKRNRCTSRASALTYYSLFAIVPALAFIFGIAKGFGMDDFVEQQLAVLLEGQEEMLERILIFVRSLLEKTKGGLIAGIGFFVLIWTIMKLLGHIENAMNDIWKIAKQRTLIRKCTDYLSIILIAPVFLIISSSATFFITSNVDTYISNTGLQNFTLILLECVPWVISCLLFTLIFLIMPNGKIPPVNAIIAGVLTGTAAQVVFHYFYTFQVYISSLNVIYGSFAAIPLFFIWLRITWMIILFGAELSFAISKEETYILEEDLKLSERRKKIYALLIMHVIVRRFENKKRAYTAAEISRLLAIPFPFVIEILKVLLSMGLITKVSDNSLKNHAYQPAYDTHTIRVADVIKILDTYNYKDEVVPDNNEAIAFFSDTLDKIDKIIETSEINTYLKDLKFDFLENNLETV